MAFEKSLNFNHYFLKVKYKNITKLLLMVHSDMRTNVNKCNILAI